MHAKKEGNSYCYCCGVKHLMNGCGVLCVGKLVGHNHNGCLKPKGVWWETLKKVYMRMDKVKNSTFISPFLMPLFPFNFPLCRL